MAGFLCLVKIRSIKRFCLYLIVYKEISSLYVRKFLFFLNMEKELISYFQIQYTDHCNPQTKPENLLVLSQIPYTDHCNPQTKSDHCNNFTVWGAIIKIGFHCRLHLYLIHQLITFIKLCHSLVMWVPLSSPLLGQSRGCTQKR